MAVREFVDSVWDRILGIEDEGIEEIEEVAEPEPPQPRRAKAAEQPTAREPESPRLRIARPENARLPIVSARPRSMEDATEVAERVKERVPLVMNLEGVEESASRRIVDFVGGVVFALDGSLKKVGRAVYICAPCDIPIEELRSESPMAAESWGSEDFQMRAAL